MSTVCVAELTFRLPLKGAMESMLSMMRVTVYPLDFETAFLAGLFHREYRNRGGTRTRILADFLIAAHAQLHADQLLTRDSRFFSGAFPNLKAVAPEDL
jgi:predicted nucleic acid-binding protein